MRRLLYLCALIGCLAALSHADEWTKTFVVTEHPSLWVRTNDASVRIYGGASNQVAARVETHGWTIGGNGVKIDARQNGSRVELEVRIPREWGFHAGWHNRSVSVELTVPRQADLDVNTGDGHIEARDIDGEIHLGSGDGDIVASGLAGTIQAHSGDGNMTFDRIKCQCRLDTSDGRIVAHDLDGSLRGGSGDGSIEIDGRFDVLELHTNDGQITAEAQRGSTMAADWTLHSGDGSITLRLPDNFSADFEAHTGDGHVDVNFPVTVSGRVQGSHLEGKLNAGGRLLKLTTADGSIHLERL